MRALLRAIVAADKNNFTSENSLKIETKRGAKNALKLETSLPS